MQDNRNTFYHRAATCCLLAPFVAIGANLALMGARVSQPAPSRMASLIPALILGGIMLLGVVLGILSLFGIRRYGAAGILWKSVTGLSIFLLLLVAAIPAFLKARQVARQRYEQRYGHPPP